jgi:3-dehydroquinate synthase
VRVKAAVVGRDEREEANEGGRALLNLGHTFAHAIETLPGLSPDGKPGSAPLQHGEAVAVGLVAAARCAEAAGLCQPGLAARVRLILAKCALPTALRGLPPPDQVLSLMAHDKKVLGGRLRLVLPTAPGRTAVVADPPKSAVVAALEAIRA